MRVLIACFFLTIACQDYHHYHYYLWAQYNQLEGNPHHATQCYEKLLSMNTPHYIIPGYLAFLAQNNNYEKIIQLVPTLKSPLLNVESQIIYAHALEKMGKVKESAEIFISAAHQHPHNSEVIYYAAHVLMRTQEFAQAFELIDKYLEAPHNPAKKFIFYFLKAQLYSLSGSVDKALACAQQVIEEHPTFAQAWILIGMLQEQQGNTDQALYAYTRVLELENNPLIMQQMQKLNLQKNKLQELLQQKLFAESSALFNKKEYTAAMKKIDECLELGHHDMYLLFKIELCFHLNDLDQATQVTLTQLKKAPSTPLWYKVAHTITRTKEVYTTTILETLNTIGKENPDIILPFLYQADLYRRSSDHIQLQENILSALPLTHNATLKMKLYYYLAQSYYQSKQWDNVQTTLNSALALDIPYGDLYNLAAYFYAHHGNNLTKATLYSKKARALEPKNIHFLDTHAYIKYKQHAFDKAYTQWEAMINNNHVHHCIFKHRAMLEKQKNNTAQAQQFLTKALACVPQNCPKKAYYQKLLAHL